MAPKNRVVLVAPKNRVVLSNMLEIENKEDPTDSSFYVVKFAITSTIMSTYLVAIVVESLITSKTKPKRESVVVFIHFLERRNKEDWAVT